MILKVGQTLDFNVRGRDAEGNECTGAAITVVSSAPSVLSVAKTPGGNGYTAKALTAGSANITCTYAGASASVQAVTVVADYVPATTEISFGYAKPSNP